MHFEGVQDSSKALHALRASCLIQMETEMHLGRKLVIGSQGETLP